MPFVAFLLLAAGAWLVDSAVQGRKPLQTLGRLITSGDLEGTLSESKGEVAINTVGGGTGDPGTSAGRSTGATPATGTGVAAGGAAGAAITFALAQVGKPYKWGGTGPDSWDCSGLMQGAYAAAGVKIPRTSYAQLSLPNKVTRAELMPGDIVWPFPGHVYMYLGDNQIVEAPKTGVPVRRNKMYGFMTARRPTAATNEGVSRR